MRHVLFLPDGETDLARLEAALESEPFAVTASWNPEAAGALLSAMRFDALIVAESLCEGTARPGTFEVVQSARRLNIPVHFFPAPLALDPTGSDQVPLDRVFDAYIRPSFQARGSDVEIVEADGALVIVRFLGAGLSCPAIRTRHRLEIQRFLRCEIPGSAFIVADVDEPFPVERAR